MARLILTINNKVLSSHKLAPGEELTIGRHPGSGICIDALSVSARHAVVRMDDQQLILSDLRSRNGTFVNDERVGECRLAHQDWITIGKHICIVDLYESLSLEATENELKARASAGADADQTILMKRDGLQPGWIAFDYLSFLNAAREDVELDDRVVTIGKNKDADIKIGGFWSVLAGEPSATITMKDEDYILQQTGGKIKPRINGTAIEGPTRLNHQDIIKIGPVEMQIRCVRRPSK